MPFSPLPVLTQTELQTIAEARHQEALVLLTADPFSGAHYLLGYVAETALKACLCRTLGITFPTTHGGSGAKKATMTHNLDELVFLAGLETPLRDHEQQDRAFAVNWRRVKQWSPEARYTVISATTRTDVEEFLQALTDPTSGVFTWIKTLPQWQLPPTSSAPSPAA